MTDRLRDAFAKTTEQADPRRLYRGIFEYTVVLGTPGVGPLPAVVAARPTDNRLPELVGLECYPSAVVTYATPPIVTTTVPIPGATIYVAFANADPAKPFVLQHPFTRAGV